MNKIDCHSSPPHRGWLANSQHKGHTKRCLEIEKNTIGHMTFAGQPTLSVWANHTCKIHSTYTVSVPY